MLDRDTIAAIATPAGVGGIGIVRVSGSEALAIAKALFTPKAAHFVDFRPWVLHRGCVHTYTGAAHTHTGAVLASGGAVHTHTGAVLAPRGDLLAPGGDVQTHTGAVLAPVGDLLAPGGDILDDALLVYMPAPNTYTGEPCVEFQCHGSMSILTAVLEAVLQAGARLADRGEFTRRAYLHGRLDLSQAEAVGEVVHAPSLQGAQLALAKLQGVLGIRVQALRDRLEDLRLQLSVSLDFPEEEVGAVENAQLIADAHEVVLALETLLASFERARIWREGFTVALAGPVNAGKSSLMNALLGRERAIVTAVPGTTRDFLEESLMLDGLPARLIDTAGLRTTAQYADSIEEIEAEGMRRGQLRAKEADVVLVLIDGCFGMTDVVQACLEDFPPERILLVWNKGDIATPPANWHSEHALPVVAARCVISAQTGEGLEELAKTLRRIAMTTSQSQEITADTIVPNMRQAIALQNAREALLFFIEALQTAIPHDLASSHVDAACAALETLTGLDTPDEVLNRIFEAFCIGK